MPKVDHFTQFDMRAGTVAAAIRHPNARYPAHQPKTDLGPRGIMNPTLRSRVDTSQIICWSGKT